jgi:hypothetical protein
LWLLVAAPDVFIAWFAVCVCLLALQESEREKELAGAQQNQQHGSQQNPQQQHGSQQKHCPPSPPWLPLSQPPDPAIRRNSSPPVRCVSRCPA